MFNIKAIDRMDSATPWTVLGNDTVNLASSTVKILGKYSLEFDKTNGAANSTIAGAYRAIDLNLDAEGAQPHDKLQWCIYLSALTNVANCFIKIGTDASNNNQYLVADTSLRTGWTLCTAVLAEPYAVNGTGWDPLNITYLQVGVTFDAETDALADIKVDSIMLVPSRYMEDNTTISMDGVSVEANLDALEVLVAATNALLGTIDTDTGNCATDLAAIELLLAVGTGVMASAQAVTLATDDTQFGAVGADADVDGNIHGQLRSIGEAAELIDDAIGTDDSAAPSKSMQAGIKYEVTKTEVDDGDSKAISGNSFGDIELASHDRATGTALVTDISPFASKYSVIKNIDVTLDDNPTSDTGAAIFIGDCNKVAFQIKSAVTWDNSDPDVYVTYTFEISNDNSEWTECDVVMSDDGEDAPVASIVHTSGGDSSLTTEETAYLAHGFGAKYLRVVATATGSDAGDTVACEVWVFLKKG